MLREALEWLVTPAGWAARGFGLVRESVAMGARYRRCRKAWEPHLARCRAAMLEAAGGCEAKGTVVVCGSGWWFDVPVPELAGMFRRVVLADVVHPLPARWRARRFANVRLLDVDLTGLLEQAGTWREGLDAARIVPVMPTALEDWGADLTISANVLTQLPLPIKARLVKTEYAEEEVVRVCRGIMRAHVQWLAGLPGRRLLITDTESRDVDGEVVLEATDLLCGLRLPPGDAAWTWRLAPRPEAGRRFDRIRDVVAVSWQTRGTT